MKSDYDPYPLVGFKSRKAAQIAAYFAAQSATAIEKLKLIKLIYLAEREHVTQYGRPMLYDELFGLKDGPICSSALNGINGNFDSATWKKFVSKDGNQVAPRSGLERRDLDEISEAEFEILSNIWGQFGRMSASQLRNFTHDHCPEYVEVEAGRLPISYKALLAAVGRPDAEDASDSIDEYRRVQALLTG